MDAEKCLANVALSQAERANLTYNNAGMDAFRPGYSAKAVDAALVHLHKSLVPAPQDLSLNRGRMHVLEVAGRYDAMLTAAC